MGSIEQDYVEVLKTDVVLPNLKFGYLQIVLERGLLPVPMPTDPTVGNKMSSTEKGTGKVNRSFKRFMETPL